MDILTEMLPDLRLSGVSYGRCDLTAPWGIEFEAQNEARFHFVAEGECWLQSDTLGAIHLQAGDVAVLPQGTDHTLSDQVESTTKPLEAYPVVEIGDRTYHLTAGGGGTRTLLFCCSIQFEEPTIHPLRVLMPPLLLLNKAAAEDVSLPTFLDAMAGEVVSPEVGSATILSRLAEIMMTKVIRAWIKGQGSGTTGWLAAIRDPQIGTALVAIHKSPGDSWSVPTLAKKAGLSRSVFAERFLSLVGVSPARYLARWRMHLAGEWLRRERLTVAETAERLGYSSEASFSRAFKRMTGKPPSTVRRAGAE